MKPKKHATQDYKLSAVEESEIRAAFISIVDKHGITEGSAFCKCNSASFTIWYLEKPTRHAVLCFNEDEIVGHVYIDDEFTHYRYSFEEHAFVPMEK